jgi:hypothetical protein
MWHSSSILPAISGGECFLSEHKIQNGPAKALLLLPGHHMITFAPNAIGSIGTPITEDVFVEAGKTYRGRARPENMRLVSQQHLGDATRYTTSFQFVGSWSVEITEVH